MGRFGTAALRPIYELIARGGCKLSPDGGSGWDHATFDPKPGRSGLFGAIPNLLRRHWGREISARPMESSMRWLPQPIRLFLWTTKLPAQLLRPEQRKIPPAQRDIGLWTERVPTEVNSADLPSRDRELSFETEPVKELASLSDILPTYDFSWVALQRAKWPFCEIGEPYSFLSKSEP